MKIKYGSYLTMSDYMATEIFYKEGEVPSIETLKADLLFFAQNDKQYYEEITEIENRPEDCTDKIFGEWLFKQLMFTTDIRGNSIKVHIPAEHQILSFMFVISCSYYENPAVIDMKDIGWSAESDDISSNIKIVINNIKQEETK